MNKIKYKILALLLVGFTFLHAQKFEKKFTKKIASGDGTILLDADYADIEIVEWNKDEVKLEAIMTVVGVSKKRAQSRFDKWQIDIKRKGATVHVISKNNNRFLRMLDIDFDSLQFDMPELSLESLHVLDSFDFSFPALKIDSVFINNIAFYNASLDSIGNFSFNLKTTELNTQNIEKWQKENKQKMDELKKKYTEYAKDRMKEKRKVKMKLIKAKYQKIKEQELKEKKKKEKVKKLRKLVNEKRKKQTEKRKALQKRIYEQRLEIAIKRAEIKKILAKRKKIKSRTKLVLYVPKGTNFSFNIRYSKLRYSK